MDKNDGGPAFDTGDYIEVERAIMSHLNSGDLGAVMANRHSVILSALRVAAEFGSRDWRTEFLQARDALFHLKYPPCPIMLLQIADEIDCGSGCDFLSTEWDTNAHICSRSDRDEGCAGERATELRDFANAVELRSAMLKARTAGEGGGE